MRVDVGELLGVGGEGIFIPEDVAPYPKWTTGNREGIKI